MTALERLKARGKRKPLAQDGGGIRGVLTIEAVDDLQRVGRAVGKAVDREHLAGFPGRPEA